MATLLCTLSQHSDWYQVYIEYDISQNTSTRVSTITHALKLKQLTEGYDFNGNMNITYYVNNSPFTFNGNINIDDNIGAGQIVTITSGVTTVAHTGGYGTASVTFSCSGSCPSGGYGPGNITLSSSKIDLTSIPTILTINYDANGADVIKFEGAVVSNSKLREYKEERYYGQDYPYGLCDADNVDFIYLLKTGYHYRGTYWNSKADGSGVDQTWLGSFNTTTLADKLGIDLASGSKSVTFYCQWEPNTYTITYDSNGGVGTTSMSNHTYNSSKKLNKNNFTKSGYTFLGWAKNSNASSIEYSDEQSIKNLTTTNNGNITLYAVWRPNLLTINYNGNGNESYIENNQTYNNLFEKSLSYNYSNDTPITDIPILDLNHLTLHKTGYYYGDGFNNEGSWNTKPDGSGYNLFYEDYTNNITCYDLAQKLNILAEIQQGDYELTIYVNWSKLSCSVIFDANNDKGETNQQYFIYGEPQKLLKNNFTYANHRFKHWIDDNGETYRDEQLVTLYPSQPSQTFYFTAIWESSDNDQIYVKVENNFKSGKVYIKSNNNWILSDSVYIKKDNEWIRSSI